MRALSAGISAIIRLFERLYDPFEHDGAPPPKQAIAFAWWVLRPLRGVLILYGLLSLSIGALEVAIIQAIGGLVDRAAAGPDVFFEAHGGFMVVTLLLVGVARPILVTAQGIVMSLGLGPSLPQAAIWRLHRHMLGQSLGFYQDDFAGRLAQKEVQSGQALFTVVSDSLNAIGMMLAFAVGMTLALAASDWRLAVPAVLWGLGYGGLLLYALPRIRRAARHRADVRAGVTGQLVDSYSNITTVKLFAHSAREADAAQGALARYRNASFAFGREVTTLRAGLNAMNAGLMVSLLGVGLWLWSSGAGGVSAGGVAAAGVLAFRATGMAGWIAFTALSIFSEYGTLEDGIKTLTPDHRVTDKPDAAALGRVAGEIGFEQVGFHYGRESGIIDELTLRIAPGEKVALVGPSGAGKSTLVSLLLRLYDVEQGRVCVDSRDIRDVTQDSLRRQIGVITQETAMFNRSALENIAYGRLDADPEEIEEAARRARADEFIRDLRDFKGREGYEAHLGERGVKLSGGQRQRIALARALLKDAPILVLDEATSALDSEVEAAILETLGDAMQGRTVLAIAHRLSTIAQMDRIVVLDHGRIVEEGPHDALLTRDGLYASLWARQSGGFLGGARPVAAE